MPRKALPPDERRVVVSIRLRPCERCLLQVLGGGNISKGLNSVIEYYVRRKRVDLEAYREMALSPEYRPKKRLPEFF